MPEIHVYIQWYALQPNSVPNIEMTLTAAHILRWKNLKQSGLYCLYKNVEEIVFEEHLMQFSSESFLFPPYHMYKHEDWNMQN